VNAHRAVDRPASQTAIDADRAVLLRKLDQYAPLPPRSLWQPVADHDPAAASIDFPP